MKRILPGLIGAALLLASGASAQEAIPTAAGAGAPPTQPNGIDPTWITKDADEHDDRGPVPIGPCGAPYKQTQDGQLKQDKDPHGQVWAGVGNHGYRDIGGAVCIPVGQNAEVNIAVDANQWSWGRR
jgi:hypothetical protein